MSSDNFEIDKLKSIVAQERKNKDKLEQHCDELELAISEMEEQKQKSDEQNSEWKTRFEIQQELNEQLRKQLAALHDKVPAASSKSKAFQKSSRATAPVTEFGEQVTDSLLAALNAEKRALLTQLINLELRIDQEAKAYHKANEERKVVQQDASAVSAQLSALRLRMARNDDTAFDDAVVGQEATARANSGLAGGSVSLKNIPQNQRVIDPKKGPIKRTAAVKQLPPLS